MFFTIFFLTKIITNRIFVINFVITTKFILTKTFTMKKFILTKTFLLLLLFLGIMPGLKAQDFLPFANDNYAGITGIHVNPASIADSRYKVDVTLTGLSLNMYNNYLYLNRDYLSEFGNIGLEGFDIRANLLKNNTGNGDSKFIYQDMRLDIMNFMITINPRIAIGFTSGIRQVLNVDNVSETMADMLYGLDHSHIPFNQKFNESSIRTSTSAWAEYGISVAGVLYKSNHHVVKAGMNMKLIQGLGSAYLHSENLNYTKINDSIVRVENAYVNYGIGSGIGAIMSDREFDRSNLNGKFSMGFDFGIVWEWRPDYESHLYDMDGKTGLERRDENKYKLRVGLSVKDLGVVRFQRWEHSKDFIVNGDINVNIFEDVSDPEEFFNVIETNSGLFEVVEGDEIYRMSLPTAVSLQVDYNLYKDFYLNFTPYIALRQGDSKYAKVHTYNNFSLSPRYERTWFGISMPIQYNQLSGLSFGTGLRLGPVWVGSNNVFNTFFSKEIDGLNVQALVKVPIPYTRVKDSDGDGVSDKNDLCKDVWGILKKQGCPEDDRDGDGVADDVDVCPDIYGLAQFNGCPDSDNDGIPDMDDECPNIAGPKEFNGCPDTDGDGLRDIEDECPNIYGLMEFNGCPDTDNDSIPDHIDACPMIKGLAQFNGCPDTDGDGIQDSEDECPEEPGTAENNGCPVYEKVEFAIHIGFKSGKAKLTQDSYQYLDQLVQLMNDNPDCWVKLDGHTDSTGSDAINNKLSQDRVDAIKFYLVDKGINPNRIVARGHGSSMPIAPNDTAEGRAKNRRVDINLAH